MNILLVEDDLRISELVERGLTEAGFAVTRAFNGEEGKKLALRHDYDLVITDILLPGLSGLELCKLLRVTKPDTPIIMLTALGTTDEKVEGFDAGADDYLVKPFELRELVVRIRAVLSRHRRTLTQSGNVLRYADIELNLHTKMVTRQGQEVNLTPKE